MIGFAAFVGMLTPKQVPLEAVEFMPIEVDFGERDPNELARTELVVSNTSSGIAKINGILPSCACITVEPTVFEVLPNGITQVVVRMKMSSWQDQPIRFQLAVMLDGQSEIIVIPVKAQARQIFESEATRDDSGRVESLTIRAVDGSAFKISVLPWFATEDDSLSQSNTLHTIQVDHDKSPPTSSSPRDETAHIVLEHKKHGEVKMAWRQPNAVPGPSSPPMQPDKSTIEVESDKLAEGVPIQLFVRGPGVEDIPHISVTPTLDTEIWQMSMSPEPGGLQVTLVLRTQADNWAGDTLVFNWKDMPACTVTLTPSTSETDAAPSDE